MRVFIQYTELSQSLDGDGRACAAVFAVLNLEGKAQTLRPTFARHDAGGVDALRADLRDQTAPAGAHDLRVETLMRPADQLRMCVHGRGEARAGGSGLGVEAVGGRDEARVHEGHRADGEAEDGNAAAVRAEDYLVGIYP